MPDVVVRLLSPGPDQLASADDVLELAVSSVVLSRITKQGWEWSRGARFYTGRSRRAIVNSSACRRASTAASSNRDPEPQTWQMGRLRDREL